MPRYRWIILVAAFFLQAMYTLLQQGLPILTPFFHSAFNLSLAETGTLVSAFNAGLVISSLPSGLLVDRVGERWSVTGGAAIACGLTLATLLVGRLPVAVGGLLFVAGLLSGTVNIASGKSVFSWFDAKERGLAMGIRQVAVPVGAGIAAMVLPLLAGWGGWQLALASMGSLQLVAGMIFLASLRPAPGEAPATQPAMLRMFASVLRDRPLITTASVSVILVWAQYVLLAYLILFLTQQGFSAVIASTGLLVVQVGAVIGRLVWGGISDRVFDGGRTPAVLRIIVLATGAIAALSAIGRGWPVWAVYLLLLAVGGTALSWNGLVVTLMAELGGSARAGAAMGMNATSVFLGALVATPLFGAIIDASHSYRVAFLALAGSTLCSLIPLLMVHESRHLHRAPALVTP